MSIEQVKHITKKHGGYVSGTVIPVLCLFDTTEDCRSCYAELQLYGYEVESCGTQLSVHDNVAFNGGSDR